MLDETWQVSSRSSESANCVQVRKVDDVIQVRNSKNPGGPVVDFTPGEWAAFTGGVEDGEFQL